MNHLLELHAQFAHHDSIRARPLDLIRLPNLTKLARVIRLGWLDQPLDPPNRFSLTN